MQSSDTSIHTSVCNDEFKAQKTVARHAHRHLQLPQYWKQGGDRGTDPQTTLHHLKRSKVWQAHTAFDAPRLV